MPRKDLNTQEWRNLREIVLKRDGYRCAYCGNEAETVDHITPVNLGGGNELSNLLAACNRCNGIKSDRVHYRTPWVSPNWNIKL